MVCSGRLRQACGVIFCLAVVGQARAETPALVAFVDARGDLAADAHVRTEIFRGGPLCDVAVGEVVCWDGGGGPMAVRKLSRVGCGEEIDAGAGQAGYDMAGALAEVVAWGAGQARPHQPLVLVVFGHGAPVGMGEDEGAGVPLLLGDARGQGGLGPVEFAGAIRAGLARAGRERVEVCVLEACFGASLELWDELDGLAAWVIAAPGEVFSPGLEWDQLLRIIAGNAGEGGGKLASVLMSAIGDCREERVAGGSWSMSAARLDALNRVREALAQVSTAGQRDLRGVVAAAVRARQQAAHGEALRQLCDVGQLATALGDCAETPELQQAASELKSAVTTLVAHRALVAGGSQGEGGGRSGATLFLPPPLSSGAARYEAASRLARSTGYAKLVQSYLEYCAGRVPELAAGVTPGAGARPQWTEGRWR